MIDTPSEKYILDLNAARINHVDDQAKAGAYRSIN